MAKTLNGRPCQLGSMYFERHDGGYNIRKYCVGYVDGKKIGLTPEELREFAENTCTGPKGFLARLAHAKLLIP